jgi:glucose-1-phosphate adenylyltransferase
MLFTRVRVHSFASVEDSVLLPKVEVGRNCVVRRAVIDRGCILPEGMRIGIDPDADRARFHVSEDGVVLVTPEMLGQARGPGGY